MTAPAPHCRARRTRVAIVIGSLDVGGAERHLCQVLPKLAGDEFEIAVLTLTHKGKLAPILEAAGIEVVAPSVPTMLLGHRLLRVAVVFRWLLGELRRRRADIVHTFLPEAYLTAGLASVLLRTPIRVMSRRSLNYYQQRMPAAAWMERRLHRRMTALLGNSAAVTEQLAAEAPSCGGRVRLIYNGIDLAPFADTTARAEMRRRLGIPAGATVFITVANLIPYKGHADEIAAFGRAAATLPQPWRLLMVGKDNGIQPELCALAESLGLSENIVWIGQRDDVPCLLRAADIGVLTSHEEGFSNSVLEGMAARLPMIVTDVGGNRELITDGVNGLLVPARDPAKLATALSRLAGDRQKREAVAAAAHRTICERFTLETCVEAYRSLYRELAAQHGRVAG